MAIVAQINVTMDDSGKVEVQGNIENKLLAVGLLEIAKDAVFAHHKNSEKRIVPPPIGFPTKLS